MKNFRLSRLIAALRLFGEKENFGLVYENIEKGVVFKGTNLWILVFAIFIASLGLNVNSTAVIIGAMLISPLMGPIMGMGFSAGVNNPELLKKSLLNFLLAVAVSLATSTFYFLVSPLEEAHSEILARTSPSLYDVLIALFGGLAGILALSSKQKGNVIPGVAIATALMPPLCTAGFGLATLNAEYFFGALYLFFINTVFIAWATYIGVRVLKFPAMSHTLPGRQANAKRLITAIVIITMVPSLLFAWRFIRQSEFEVKAKKFIRSGTEIQGNYLFGSEVDPAGRSITLVYGGSGLSDDQRDSLMKRLGDFNLENASLEIRQGIQLLEKKKLESEIESFRRAIVRNESAISDLNKKLERSASGQLDAQRLRSEIRALFPEFASVSFAEPEDTARLIVLVEAEGKIRNESLSRLSSWLEARSGKDTAEVVLLNKEKSRNQIK